MHMRGVWLSPAVFLVTLAARAVVQAPTQQPPAQPQIQLGPGLREVPDYRKVSVEPAAPQVPDGFTPIFNGKDLAGWHISTTARHGVQPDFHVSHGMILGTQKPLGSGGLLLTDKKYRNFELYFEAKPDWGCDSGVFFRTTDTGVAYQITMDYLPGGSMGRMIGEGGIQVTSGAGRARGAAAAGTAPQPAPPPPPPATPLESNDPGMKAWKPFDWNTIRVRVDGDVPHATVSINGVQVSDATDTENHALGGMIEGPIAIQIHGGPVRWQPGGFWRWRNIGIKAL
jgi:3-keto-disaccharide hydrolase